MTAQLDNEAAVEPAAPPTADRRPRHAAPIPAWRRWTAPPVAWVGLGAAAGVLIMSVGAATARHGGPVGWAQALWVVGLLAVFAPALYRVLLPGTGSRERVAIALVVPVVLQVSRLTLFPTFFAFHDELIHATTLRRLVESDGLFSANPLLPVSAFYPGLELVAGALHDATGLSLFASGVLTLTLARVILSCAIVALALLVTRSGRAAAIAGLLYVVNPQFLFFNSQFSYQTLALPLAVFTVYVFATRPRGRWWAWVLPLTGMAMVLVTHHVTAMLLIAAFAVWLAAEVVLAPRRSRAEVAAPSSGAAGLVAMVLAGLAMWVTLALVPGNPVGGYLDAIVDSSATDVDSLTQGEQTKAVFANTAGVGPAPWEQALLLAAVAICMAALITALLFGRESLRRRDSLGVLLALIGLLFPVIPAGHLTRATAEVGDRAAGFVFVGLAIATSWWLARRVRTARAALLVTLLASVAYLGNIVLGAGPTAGQLPGPYLISADARSVDADNRAAAGWLATGIAAGSNVYGDRISGLLAAAEGDQDTVRHVSTGIDASRLLLDPELTDADLDLIRRADLSYLIVDRRLAAGLPQQQVYVENGEFGQNGRTEPVPATALAKFAAVPGVQRIYDNGSIAVYDLRELRDAD